MSDNRQIYLAAASLIVDLGPRAQTAAAMRSDAFLDADDRVAQAQWLQVLSAVKNLLMTEPNAQIH